VPRVVQHDQLDPSFNVITSSPLVSKWLLDREYEKYTKEQGERDASPVTENEGRL
jgi:hypothetical protein